MINWLLLVPMAVVVVILADRLAWVTVVRWPRLRSHPPKADEATVRSAQVANLLGRVELPVLVLTAPLFLFTSPLTVVALAIIPLLWGARRLIHGYFLPRTPLDWPIALMAVMIPVGLLVSPYFGWGAGRAAFLVYCVALYYALVDWISSPRRFDHAFVLYLLAGGGMALLALVGTDWQSKFPFLGDLTSALPQIANFLSRDGIGFHPNIVAGALLWVLFPLLGLALWVGRTTYDLWLVLALTVFIAGTLVLTQSRGALVSAIAGLGLLAWLKWPRLRPVVAIGGVVAITLVSMALIMEIGAGKQVAPESDFSMSAADNFAVRVDTWHSALLALSAHPIAGIGLDAFRHLLPTTYPAASIPNSYDIGHAHNQFVQAALDLGVVGLLGYLALWFAAGRMVWVMLAHGAKPTDRTYDLRLTTHAPLLAGFAAALFASFLHGMIDVVVIVSKPGVLFWAMLGLVAGLWRLTAKERLSTLQE